MDVDRGRLGTERHLGTDFWMYEPAQKRSARKEQHQKSDLGNSRELSPVVRTSSVTLFHPQKHYTKMPSEDTKVRQQYMPFFYRSFDLSSGTYQQGC